MSAAHVTLGDLQEAARRAGARDEHDIDEAQLERNGEISIRNRQA